MLSAAFSAMVSSERVPYFDAIIRVVLMVYVGALFFHPLLSVQRNGFILLLGLLVGWCVANQRLFHTQTPYDRVLLVFVVWVGFTISFAVVPLYSLKEYGKLLQHMVVFYAVIYFFKEPRHRQILLGLIGILAVIATAYGLWQFDLSNAAAVRSFFAAEVWFTTFLVMVIPFVLALALGGGPPVVRGAGAIVAGMMMIALMGTQSRAGLLALVGEVWVVTWFIRSGSAKTVAVLVSAIVLFIVASSSMALLVGGVGTNSVGGQFVYKGFTSMALRFEIWNFTLSEIAKHWLVGIGYGDLSSYFLYHEDQAVIASINFWAGSGTHNLVLYLALHIGVPGLLIFGWFIVQFILKTVEAYRHASEWLSKVILVGATSCVTGVMIRVQFDQMLVGSLAVFFWVLLALAVLSYTSCDECTEDSHVRKSGVVVGV